MAEYKQLAHTAEEIDQAIEDEKTHSADTVSHITSLERETWNKKANTSDITSAVEAETLRATTAEQTNTTAIDALRNDTFGVPAGRVTSNSDLNTFTTYGAFLCLSSAVGKTIVNCPVEAGFRLEVKSLAAGTERCVQLLYPNINNDVIFYVRRLLSTGWTVWRAVTGTEAPAINTASTTAE